MIGSVVFERTEHHQGDWDLSKRLQVGQLVSNSSTTILPDGHWRTLEASELVLVDGARQNAAPDEGRVSVFCVPERLRKRFWTLDFERLLEHDEFKLSREFSAFRDDIVSFLRFIGADRRLSLDARIVASLPNRLTTRIAAESGSMGLQFVDNADKFYIINFGDQSRSTLFLSAVRDQMDGTSLDRCLVIRLAMAPGEGCCFPSSRIAFDGCTLDMDEPDFVVELKANQNPGMRT